MFGLFKSSPASNFKYHLGAIDKQFSKAVKKFIDADQWLSGKGISRDPMLCKVTAEGAVGKAQKRLSEAMWNANDAMKAISKSPQSDRALMTTELDVACLKFISINTYGEFKEEVIEESFSDSMHKWHQEYETLKVKYGLEGLK